MQISDILETKKPDVVTARGTDSVMTAVEILHRNNIGALVVVDEERRISGMLSERDIVHGLAEHGERALQLKVADLMNERVYICKPDDRVKEAMNWITRYRVRHLPVVEQNELKGIISIGDVVKHRLEEVETEANVLRDIVTARP